MSNQPAPTARPAPRTTLALQLTKADVQFPEYSIVGQYADNDGKFVRHTALLAKRQSIKPGDAVPVWHIGPPIVYSQEGQTLRADLISDLALTPSELKKMATWRSKVAKEKRPDAPFQQYKVAPPIEWRAAENGQRLYRRFSCVGFVLDCYGAARIRILDLAATFPVVSEKLLIHAYPFLANLDSLSDRVKARLGFRGLDDLGLEPDQKQWRIVLPGYVFHSAARADGTVPRPPAFVPPDTSFAYFPFDRVADNTS